MIETQRLLIRKFITDDLQDFYDYLSLSEIYRFEPGEPLMLEQTRELLAQRAQGNEFFAVELKENHKMIGHLYFARVEPTEWQTYELGYIFNPSFQGKGYATEAAAALVDHAFTQLGVHRILARCDPENVASWRLLEKVGFIREGHFKQNHFFNRDENGNPLWRDAYEYAIRKKGVEESTSTMRNEVYHGILVDASFEERGFPLRYASFAQKKAGDWLLCGVEIPRANLKAEIQNIQKAMRDDQPFYAHLYNDEEVIVIFKYKVFWVTPHRSSWQEIMQYGRTLNIPLEQLDFWPNRFQDEPHYFG